MQLLKKAVLGLGILFITVFYAHAQEPGSKTGTDVSGKKMLTGLLSINALAADTVFSWFAANSNAYIPPSPVVSDMQQVKDSIYYMVFLGTWCSDSHFIIPRFLKLFQQAAIADSHLTLVGVDNNKKTLAHLTEPFQVKNVPTIILFKNGKEIGRVVEYGTTGMFEKDITQILQKTGATKKQE